MGNIATVPWKKLRYEIHVEEPAGDFGGIVVVRKDGRAAAAFCGGNDTWSVKRGISVAMGRWRAYEERGNKVKYILFPPAEMGLEKVAFLFREQAHYIFEEYFSRKLAKAARKLWVELQGDRKTPRHFFPSNYTVIISRKDARR